MIVFIGVFIVMRSGDLVDPFAARIVAGRAFEPGKEKALKHTEEPFPAGLAAVRRCRRRREPGADRHRREAFALGPGPGILDPNPISPFVSGSKQAGGVPGDKPTSRERTLATTYIPPMARPGSADFAPPG